MAVSPWASMSDDVNLTSQQLADRLQVHPDTVRAWADSGRIPFYRTPGGHRRFHFYAVREALETGEVQS